MQNVDSKASRFWRFIARSEERRAARVEGAIERPCESGGGGALSVGPGGSRAEYVLEERAGARSRRPDEPSNRSVPSTARLGP